MLQHDMLNQAAVGFEKQSFGCRGALVNSKDKVHWLNSDNNRPFAVAASPSAEMP